MSLLKFTFIYNLKNRQCSKGAKLEAQLSEVLLYFHTRLSFYFLCFKSRLHQIMPAKFMPPKKVCLQLETIALITCSDTFLKHPIIFVQLYYQIN